MKRVSRSETSTAGSPTSRNTDPAKLRAASSPVAVLKVGTSHTRPIRRSMRTCRKSWPERATGNSRNSRLIHPPPRVATERGYSRPAGGRWLALRRAGAHVLLHRRRQAGPSNQAARQGKRLVTATVPAQRSGVQLLQPVSEARQARKGSRRAG